VPHQEAHNRYQADASPIKIGCKRMAELRPYFEF
jgi:hypothetical protein